MDKKEYHKLSLEVCRLSSLLGDVLTDAEEIYATGLYNKMLRTIGDLLGYTYEEQVEIYNYSADIVKNEREVYKAFLKTTDGESLAGKALGYME